MIYTEGQTARLTETFLDEHDDPLDYSDDQPPRVTLINGSEIVSEAYATVDSSATPGTWVVDLPIPHMSLVESARVKAMWTFLDSDGGSHKSSQYLEVAPDVESRTGDITFIADIDKMAVAILPFRFDPGKAEVPADVVNQIPAQPAVIGDSLSVGVFINNQSLYSATDPMIPYPDNRIVLKPGYNTSRLSFPISWPTKFFEPMAVVVTHERPDALPTTYTFNCWPCNSSILSTAKQLEDFINKAQIKNVIPELDYTQGDLLMYLYRGLSLFNALEQITAFTGVNMQGYMQEAWLICSSYYALGAQLQAEGALAFDFSGQTVNLNIDRTPSIESALGRIEQQIDNVVKPLKKQLKLNGVIGGDGSIGSSALNGARKRGVLGLTNAPTTRLPYTGRNGSWFRPMF